MYFLVFLLYFPLKFVIVCMRGGIILRILTFSELEKGSFLFGDFVGIRQSWENGTGFSYLNKDRPDCGLTLILCKKAIYTFPDGRELHAAQGDLLFLPQGSRYLARFAEPRHEGKPDTLLFNFRIFDKTGEVLTLCREPMRLLGDADGVAYQHMSVAIDAINQGKTLVAERRLLQLLELAAEESACHEKNPFTAVVDYIEAHLGANPSLSELSRRFGMSTATMRRLFVSNAGMPPIAYIRRQKISRAKRMLASAELSVENICEELGFYDLSHFYKQFRLETGMTPAAYRRQQR